MLFGQVQVSVQLMFEGTTKDRCRGGRNIFVHFYTYLIAIII